MLALGAAWLLGCENPQPPALCGALSEQTVFDTEPGQSGAGVDDGSWSNYPFFASGVIAVTSQEGGVLFVKRSKE